MPTLAERMHELHPLVHGLAPTPPVCGTCRDEYDAPVQWPCPTLRALDQLRPSTRDVWLPEDRAADDGPAVAPVPAARPAGRHADFGDDFGFSLAPGRGPACTEHTWVDDARMGDGPGWLRRVCTTCGYRLQSRVV